MHYNILHWQRKWLFLDTDILKEHAASINSEMVLYLG